MGEFFSSLFACWRTENAIHKPVSVSDIEREAMVLADLALDLIGRRTDHLIADEHQHEGVREGFLNTLHSSAYLAGPISRERVLQQDLGLSCRGE
jgi:hypothetical protein